MKKGCLIVLCVFVALCLGLVIALAVGYRIANERYGISLAPAISHETYATGDTRIRLLVTPDLLAEYVADYLPEDADVPAAGLEFGTILSQILPREIALLARADVITNRLRITLFANERRGGPLIESMVNESNVFAQAPQINWTSNGLELHGRGVLFAEGDIPIPSAVEPELLEIWPTRSQEAPAAIRGGHLAELVIDNRNGDILALAAAVATASGENWERMRAQDMADMVVNIIESIYVVRLTADLRDRDTAVFSLRIDMEEASGPGLQFLISGMAAPWLRDMLKNEHNLILAGDLHWNETESAIIGTYTLSGIEAFVEELLEDAA